MKIIALLCVLLSMAELRGSIEAMPVCGASGALCPCLRTTNLGTFISDRGLGPISGTFSRGTSLVSLDGAPSHGMLMQQQGCNNRGQGTNPRQAAWDMHGRGVHARTASHDQQQQCHQSSTQRIAKASAMQARLMSSWHVR